MKYIFSAVLLLSFASAPAKAQEMMEIGCGGPSAGLIVSGKVGYCKGALERDHYQGERKNQKSYRVAIVGLGASFSASAEAFGFFCSSYEADSEWTRNVSGMYYGGKGAVNLVGAVGSAGYFYNSKGYCIMNGLGIGGGYDLSAAVLYISAPSK